MANERFFAMMEETEFLRQKLTFTERDYSEAVSSLLNLAMDDTSASRAAAQNSITHHATANVMWHEVYS